MPISCSKLGLKPKRIVGSLYQLGSYMYAQSRRLEPFDANGEFVCGIIYWAPTTGAALRACRLYPSGDEGVSIEPPSQLLLDGWRWKYNDILEAVREDTHTPSKVFSDSRGDETWRIIAIGTLTYFFRSDNSDTEPAFAVSVDLRGIRWKLA